MPQGKVGGGRECADIMGGMTTPCPDVAQCRRCLATLPVAELTTDRSKRCGKANICRPCDSERQRQYDALDPAARRARQNERSAARVDWYLRQSLKPHGLTVTEYRTLEAAQGGVCAICGRPESSAGPTRRDGTPARRKRLAVDHNHDTEQRRGLLCDRCNRGLGLFGDDVDRLLAAAGYLSHWNM